MPGRITIALPETEREALNDLAIREYRDPHDQAAKFIVDGLRAAGALPKEEVTLTESARDAVPA
jgi:hypothetical protein